MAWLTRIHHLKSLPGGRLENHQEDLQIEKRYCKNIYNTDFRRKLPII